MFRAGTWTNQWILRKFFSTNFVWYRSNARFPLFSVRKTSIPRRCKNEEVLSTRVINLFIKLVCENPLYLFSFFFRKKKKIFQKVASRSSRREFSMYFRIRISTVLTEGDGFNLTGQDWLYSRVQTIGVYRRKLPRYFPMKIINNKITFFNAVHLTASDCARIHVIFLRTKD